VQGDPQTVSISDDATTVTLTPYQQNDNETCFIGPNEQVNAPSKAQQCPITAPRGVKKYLIKPIPVPRPKKKLIINNVSYQ